MDNMYTKRTSSSIHRLNADNSLNAPNKLRWILLNLFNNIYCSNLTNNKFPIIHFSPELNDTDWQKIDKASSPPRALSDLFWMKVDWEKVRSELGNIHIFDVGCGSGDYALKLMNFSNGLVSKYFGLDIKPRKNWSRIQEEHNFITLKMQDSKSIINKGIF